VLLLARELSALEGKMILNDLLEIKGIDPKTVIVLRHRPQEPRLKKVLPWLAAERPELFNAYQQTQTERLEKAMERLSGNGYVASFIGHEPGKALFVGLYSIGEARPLSKTEYWEIQACKELKDFGMRGFSQEDKRETVLWFDLTLTEFYLSWKGKLIVAWPPPELSWWRRAHRGEMAVIAISEESHLTAKMAAWDSLILSWQELSVLPSTWRYVLSQWRGIYYIFDVSVKKGYVGSAYGENNLYGRWMEYAKTGHGGDKSLQKLDPRNFRFSILQIVSPNMSPEEVIALEQSWKERLHSKKPFGLNEN
jgi:hypothetical protein